MSGAWFARCGTITQHLTKSVPPLTARRIQVEAGALALFIWVGLLLKVTILGSDFTSDFTQFYVQGVVALQRNAELLYDGVAQTAFAHTLLPMRIPCVPDHPPQVSVLFSLFARMAYSNAELLWWLLTCVGYSLCCYAIWRACPHLRRYPVPVALATAACPSLLFLLLDGQTTVIALVAFTWAYYCLRGNRPFVAGLAIGLLAYKPQLGLVSAGIFLLTRAWRVVAGALVTGFGQYAVACWWYKRLIAVDFIYALLRLPHLGTKIYEPNEWAMLSLRPFWRMLLPSSALAFPLYIGTALAVFLCCLRIWKSASPLSLRFAAFLLATVLVDPHLYLYDLVVLTPALMLLAEWWLGSQAHHNPIFTTLVYLSYGSSLLVEIAQTNRVSIFCVCVFSALFVFLYLHSTQEHANAYGPVLANADAERGPLLSHDAGA